MKSIEYLDAVKSRKNITSDYALAKELGVTKQAVSRYYKTGGGFDDEVARRVAEILDMHPGLVMLDMHRQRATTPETQALWQKIFEGFPKLLPPANLGKGFSPA